MLSQHISSKTTKKYSIQNDWILTYSYQARPFFCFFFFISKGRRQWYLIIIPQNNDSADFKGSIISLSGNDRDYNKRFVKSGFWIRDWEHLVMVLNSDGTCVCLFINFIDKLLINLCISFMRWFCEAVIYCIT